LFDNGLKCESKKTETPRSYVSGAWQLVASGWQFVALNIENQKQNAANLVLNCTFANNIKNRFISQIL